MAPALTPALALDYVRELSADVRATIVLDAGGRLLAGSPQLADRARALLAAGGDSAELEAGSDAGVACAVRSHEHAAIAVCGRFAIGAVVRQDLRAALSALEGRAPRGPPSAAARAVDPPAGADAALTRAADARLACAAHALIIASQRAFEA